ncbi:MAG: hypothetical protein R2764_10585 [Bacteroidales bacterium]
MTKGIASKQLFIGYIFALIGFVIGANIEIHENYILSILLMGYIIWAGYWGWQISSKSINEFFSTMIVIDSNLYRLFYEFLVKKVLVYCIILSISLIIGVCGGAIYKQIQLARIAYF